METFLGLTSLFFVFVFTCVLAIRYRTLALVLLLGFSVRALAAAYQFYVAPLPDGAADAVEFERLAWFWGKDGFWVALSNYPGPDTFFSSWLISLLYGVLDRSPLMAQSLSVFSGVLTIFFGWKLALEIWGREAAKKASWIIAFFPTLILYSALILRESFIVLFLSIAFIGVVSWAREGSGSSFILAVFGFMVATFFHGAMIFFIFGLFFLIALRSASLLKRKKIAPRSMLLLLIGLIFMVGFYITDARIPKLGSIEKAMDGQRLLSIVNFSARGGASYPSWMQPDTVLELVYTAPARFFYFLYAPFPWDVEKAAHLVGLIDGFLYLILSFYLWRARKSLKEDPGKRATIILLILIVLVFSLVIGNFGTALRHRAKISVIIIALAAGLLPKFSMRRKTKLN